MIGVHVVHSVAETNITIVRRLYFATAVIALFLCYFFIEFKDQGQICNLLVMRIPKLTLIIEIDEELTEIFKVKGKAQFPKRR